jgi:assimilatory nitrate reductase electron transfer subunit
VSHVLIVGNGPAAQRLAERLRHHGHEGPLTILGSEPEPAYHRPLLTSVAAGRLAPEATRLPAPPGTRVHLGTVVTAIAPEQRLVRAREAGPVTGPQTTYAYDTLVLATGARARIPDIPGLIGPDQNPAPGVTTLRTQADAARVTGDRVVVLGGGPLGVETAAALAERGTRTTLVCTRPHPLYEWLGEMGGRMLTERLGRAGVTVIAGATAVRRESGRLLLDDKTALPADTLVLCTGAVPDTELARAAGLLVREGIVVDDELRTSDPRIHALGDCAEHRGRTTAGFGAAWEQAETLARILTHSPEPYRPLPPMLRLRTQVADVSCLGSPADLDRPGTRQLTFTDTAGLRYARLTLHDERVVAAALIGLPQAIATIGLLHRRGQQLPSDRTGLLLGLPPRPTSDGPAPAEDRTICLCNNVSRHTLRRAWQAGSRTVRTLASATRATTGCGGCARDVEELCGRWAREIPHAKETAS